MTCTFFGHHDAPSDVKEKIKNILIDLIENKNVRKFLVGNNGSFDYYVRQILIELKHNYDYIDFAVVLAYISETKEFAGVDNCYTLYPEKVANGPAKFAILRRNNYMIDNADIVITYVHRIYGGAQQFKEKSEKKGKIVINI